MFMIEIAQNISFLSEFLKVVIGYLADLVFDFFDFAGKLLVCIDVRDQVDVGEWAFSKLINDSKLVSYHSCFDIYGLFKSLMLIVFFYKSNIVRTNFFIYFSYLISRTILRKDISQSNCANHYRVVNNINQYSW